jgi:spore coat polysaccharide biosynthesis protein SpsF (cytidylyltransferase family)/organic radical activating enzyme
MKTIAVVEADLEHSPLGTASRLAEDLAGRAVLRRTIDRLRQCKRLASIHVISPDEQRDATASLVGDGNVTTETHGHGPPIWQEGVRHARKWSSDSWRGGVGGLCAFDESCHAGVLGALANREQADAVASVPAAAVLIDPTLLDAMTERLESLGDDYRLVFSQAPPGLSAILAKPAFLNDVHGSGQPPGKALAYNPDSPQLDFTNRPCCYAVPNVVIETPVRLAADTTRSIAVLAELLDGNDPDELTAEQICRLVSKRRDQHVDRLPREIEIELTTDDQLRDTTIRPRGDSVPTRGPIAAELVRRIVEELAQFDDSLVVLGGFGEPLLHPEFGQILAACRGAGIFGLAVRTNGLAMTGTAVDPLIDHDVDVVNVTVDAHSPDSYRVLNGFDGFGQVIANIEALQAQIAERGSSGPLIVPEMAKLRRTLPEQEAFFDDWIRRVGWGNVITPSHYAGQLPDQAVMNMAPPHRSRCGRLWSRLMILADGTAVTCDQDFAAKQPVGNVTTDSVETIWTGAALGNLRRAHADLALSDVPLCPACDEWHRP